jgi:hypothetical protein
MGELDERIEGGCKIGPAPGHQSPATGRALDRHLCHRLSDDREVSCPRHPPEKRMEPVYTQTTLHMAAFPSATGAFCRATSPQRAPGVQSRIMNVENLSFLSYLALKEPAPLAAGHTPMLGHSAPLTPAPQSSRSASAPCHHSAVSPTRKPAYLAPH